MAAAEYEKTIEQMKGDISSLKSDLSKLVSLFEKDGMEHLKSTIANMKDKCDFEKVDDAVKKNPKESLAIAFTAGAILALLLGGRR